MEDDEELAERATSTRDERIFAAFQGPVLGVSARVLHQHKTFTAELLLRSHWRASRGLHPSQITASLLAARPCRLGTLEAVDCPRCGRVLDVSAPTPAPTPAQGASAPPVPAVLGTMQLPDDLESYCVALRARCTSSRRHLNCSLLVLAIELLPGLVVQSEPFAVYARRAGRQKRARLGEDAATADADVAAPAPSTAVADAPVSQAPTVAASVASPAPASQAPTVVASVALTLAAPQTPAVVTVEVKREQSETLQMIAAAPGVDLEAYAAMSPLTDMRHLAASMLVVVRINSVKFVPEVGLKLMRGVVPVMQANVPGFLLQKGSVSPGLSIIVWCFKTIQDAERGMAIQKKYAQNEIKNVLDRNVVADGLVQQLALVTSW